MPLSVRSVSPYMSNIVSIFDPFKELFQLIILFVFFMGVTYVSLPKHFQDHAKGKLVAVGVGLMFTFGLFWAKKQLNFFFESFAFLGFAIVIIIMFWITFRMCTVLDIPKSVAFSLSYALTFTSFWVISPSLLDTISKSLPAIAAILILLFWVAVAFLIYKGFGYIFSGRHKDVRNWANDMKVHASVERPPVEKPQHDRDMEEEINEINKEEKLEEQEESELKKTSTDIEKVAITDIDSMDKALRWIAQILKDKPHLTNEDRAHIAEYLRQIAAKEEELKKLLNDMLEITRKWEKIDEKILHDMNNRHQKSTDQKQKAELSREYQIAKKKYDLMKFIEDHSSKIAGFISNFDDWIGRTVQSIETNRPKNETFSYLMRAHQRLLTTKAYLQQLEQMGKQASQLANMESKEIDKEKKVAKEKK